MLIASNSPYLAQLHFDLSLFYSNMTLNNIKVQTDTWCHEECLDVITTFIKDHKTFEKFISPSPWRYKLLLWFYLWTHYWKKLVFHLFILYRYNTPIENLIFLCFKWRVGFFTTFQKIFFDTLSSPTQKTI